MTGLPCWVTRVLAGAVPLGRARPFSRPLHLAAPAPANARRAVAFQLDRTLAVSRAPVSVTRAGAFWDPRYGEFDITPQMLADMVRNFDRRTYGQDIFLDVAHRPEDGAAGKITRLWVDDGRLLADVSWTPYGVAAIQDRGYQYLSAEFVDDYQDNERRQKHGALLLGAALTIRPVIKGLDPVRLAEPTALHRALQTRLLHEAETVMNKHLEKLRKRLAEMKLNADLIGRLVKAYEASAKALGEDDQALDRLADGFADTGKTLAEQLAGQPATVHLTLAAPTAGKPDPASAKPEPPPLSIEDIKRVLAEERAAEAKAHADAAKTLAERRGQFRALLEASESVKALAEPQRAALMAAESLIAANFAAEQVEALAGQQLKLAEQMAVTAKLAALGWSGQGTTRIHVGELDGPRQLQESIDRHLRDSPESENRRLKLTPQDKLRASVRCILAEFDRAHARELAEEAKRMADGGTTSTLNVGLPVGYQRTVLREALADLKILDLVNVRTDPTAGAVTMVPYEERKVGAIVNDGIVYESQPIPRASITQLFDPAYVNQQKLSLKITNEAIFFSQHSLIDWDAYARNVDSNARIVQELVARRIANEMQRAADAYGATVHAAENVAAQLAGSSSLIKTSAFPIVRPRQVKDLRGNAVGAPENPIVVTVNGVGLGAYDGSGEQPAGLYYYVENYNLGFIRLVNQAGVPQTPAASGACTVTYSEAHNLSKFDLKLPAGTSLEDHMNGLLRVFGARKAQMLADRYILPDFALMSPTLNDAATNAKQFAAEAARPGSALTTVGDLATIKGISSFGTTAPGIDLGDERILLGQRGTLTYTVVKPFVTGAPFEAVDSSGRPTAEKIAYGEEYNAIHVPKSLYNRFISLIAYDSDARAAAA